MDRVGDQVSEWWREVRGDKGIETSLVAAGRGVGLIAATVILGLLIVWLWRKIVRLKVWGAFRNRLFGRHDASIVEFYERMLNVLAEKGFVRESHQTPLEFACAVGGPEALLITRKYNEVRFGAKTLSENDEVRIQDWLRNIESHGKHE